MGNNNINQNENILVVVDQQNIVHIDPNTVLSQSGELQPRLVDHENLVMYVNLEAELIPRSIFYSESQKTTLTSLASGNFNVMRNQGDNNEFENNFDTNWTETFVSNDNIGTSRTSGENVTYDPTSQTFGIESIQIVVKGASNIPQVSINFVDVRGKTLFDSPDNSPYKAFFHQPWPIFYLTVKGYYGKAIRYRIQMVDFKARFNGNTGNFEISTKFVGSTYAFLSDMLLQNIVNAPYMYMVEKAGGYTTNTKTGLTEKKISKTTKGYSILKSVYDDYKAKGYIPADFPVKTLRELLMTATALESIIETALFSEAIDPEVLSDVNEYNNALTAFERRLIAWGTRNLNKNDIVKEVTFGDEVITYYGLNKTQSENAGTQNGPISADIITNDKNALSLISIIKDGIQKLEGNKAFGKKVDNKKQIKTKSISLDPIRNVGEFYDKGEKFSVAIEKLINRLKDIELTFVKERQKVEDAVEAKMNEVISNKDTGFGFKPTIRNIFAVIMSNADTYIRLMKDVHTKVVQISDLRKKEIGYISTNPDEPIYPWPEVKKSGKNNQPTFYYPADPQILNVTKGNNYSLWPEVEFIETYHSVATKRVDAESGKEIFPATLNFVFDGEDEKRQIRNVSSLLNINSPYPYSDKTLSNLFYEIYERAQIITSTNTFDYGKGLEEICQKEFENIDEATKNDVDIRSILSQQVKARSVDLYNPVKQETKTVNLSEIESLVRYMYSYSPRDRYPYFQDRISTVDYIKEYTNADFEIKEYNGAQATTITDNTYVNLQKTIDDYKIEDYRLNEFPFNSDDYRSYYKKLFESDYKYKNILFVNQDSNFISSPIKPDAWYYSAYTGNIFTQKIDISGKTRNILNTPYFHTQLYRDFFKGGVEGRYAGSAYLLLNSLPFKELDEELYFTDTNKILMSSLFKEIGATHYIPYHLILKWGSIYHRYKKYLLEGVDIISGVTAQISGSTFFDNATNVTFNLSGITSSMNSVTHSSNSYTGVYPYYHGVYSQIVNGYSFYNPSGFTKTTADASNAATRYKSAVDSGYTKYIVTKPTQYSGLSLTCFVDNSAFSADDKRYTILPSNNITQINDIINNFTQLEQNSFRIIFDNDSPNEFPSYDLMYFPSSEERFRTLDNKFSLKGDKRKIIDLIATFTPKLLDDFEKMFLDFCSLDLDLDNVNTSTHSYSSFQELLKEITSIDNTNIDFTKDGVGQKIAAAQKTKLETITKELLLPKNLSRVIIGNPKQLDSYTLYGFLGKSKTYSVNGYDVTQLTTGITSTNNYIKLYVGPTLEFLSYTGLTGNVYVDFFRVNDIELTEENIYNYRELARVYAGWLKDIKVDQGNTGYTPTNYIFKSYVETEIFSPQDTRLGNFLTMLIKKFSGLSEGKKTDKVTILHGFNEAKTLKLDLYQFFKSFNDKWSSGDAIGQRHLMDEFLFLDKANRDIGDEAYISLERLISLSSEKNAKIDLYSAISTIIQGTGFDMRPLPAYVNFYGTNTSNKKRVMPSKNLARSLFGTFLEVDYQESMPKVILQYVGKTSTYLSMEKVSKAYKFKDDGFDIKNPNLNPLLVEPRIFMEADLSKSNRVVSFEINFGDQAQGLFKNITLDQSTYKNTTESALAQERLARSQSGAGSHQIDIGLFDIYKTASYQCTVTCMGNVMIQPTMYFYLANVPMFLGTYLVFDVTHNIKAGGIETVFTGVRISNSTLPTLENSFMSSYRPLFGRLMSSALKKKQQSDLASSTSKSITTKDKQIFKIDPGAPVGNEDLSKIIIKESGYVLNDLLAFNGALVKGGDGKEYPEQYIQFVQLAKDDLWFRTKVTILGSGRYTPKASNGNLVDLGIVSAMKSSPSKLVKLTDIETSLYEFYSIRLSVTNKNKETIFDLGLDTEFLNPKTNTNYKLVTDINPTAGRYDGPVHNGPSIDDPDFGTYGLALCPRLMKKLRLNEGDVVYFRYIKKK